VFRQPELSLSKVTEDENMLCSSSVLRKAGTEAEFCLVFYTGSCWRLAGLF